MRLCSKINLPLVVHIEGILLLVEGLFMLSVLPVSYLHHGLYAFSMPFSALITLLVGFIAVIATRRHKGEKTTSRDGVVIVCLSWFVLSLFGAIPYLLSKSVPNFTDAFFESVSGFTTTGSTILPCIDKVPKDILLWRSLTQWLGGLAIIVFPVAILPFLNVNGMQLFVSEMNGLTVDKLHPRIMHTARRIWALYLLFTLMETMLLHLGDMDWYDAICHSMTTISSGCFSTRSANMAAFSNYSQVVVSAFMVLSGCNFSLLLLSLARRSLHIVRDVETKTLLLHILILGVAFALVLVFAEKVAVGTAFRESFFSVISAITTTGFFVTDYTLWPDSLWFVLTLLMLVGACSGSTSGGIKVVRHLIFLKNSLLELKRVIHPNAILPVKVNGKSLSSKSVFKNVTFIFVFCFVLVVGFAALIGMGIDFETSLGASLATLSNAGTAIGRVGPFSSYVFLPAIAKWMLMLFMVIGRVELFTVIILLSGNFWKN